MQTETGGHVITPLPGCTPAKPGSACFPFFGVVPVILDPETGKEMEGACEGYIAFKQPWQVFNSPVSHLNFHYAEFGSLSVHFGSLAK